MNRAEVYEGVDEAGRALPRSVPLGSIVEVLGLGPPLRVPIGNLGLSAPSQLCRTAENRCLLIPDGCLRPLDGEPPHPRPQPWGPWQAHEAAGWNFNRAQRAFFAARDAARDA